MIAWPEKTLHGAKGTQKIVHRLASNTKELHKVHQAKLMNCPTAPSALAGFL